jgi:nucleoside-diphosphate-sugar epimerase
MTRVLVTGATGDFGRDVVRRLLVRGADVVAFARRPLPDRRVQSVTGDIRDPDAVERAMRGADVVVHFAWALEPLPTEAENRAINVGGTVNVLAAMARTGCGRLVFSSSVMAYGSHPDNPEFLREDDPLRPDPRIYYAAHKAEVESLIAAAGVAAVITRPAIALGHRSVSYAARLFGMPVLAPVRGVDTRWQLIHVDDVARFHVEATLGTRTGVVNLAAPGVLSSAEFAAQLHRPVLRLPRTLMQRALGFTWKHDLLNIEPATLDGLTWPPVVDTTRMGQEWGFRCAWEGREAAADAGEVFARSVYLGARRLDAPWRIPWAPTEVAADQPPVDATTLVAPWPDGVRGEFDSLIDPRYPRYCAAATAEMFGVDPGQPLPVVLLDVVLSAIRGSATATAELLRLDAEDAREFGARSVISAGHRLYANDSLPPVPHTRRSLLTGQEAARLGRQVNLLREDVEATLSDERLVARLTLARDLVIESAHIALLSRRTGDLLSRAMATLRRLVTERGRRLAAAGHIDDADAVFSLTFDELCHGAPGRLRELARRRRDEHQRLLDLTMPDRFERRWEPLDARRSQTVTDLT